MTKYLKNPFISITLILTAGVTVYGQIDPSHIESLTGFMSEAFQTELGRMLTVFTVASWIHSGRMKKEIRANFQSLTLAIEKVADTFKADLAKQTEILDNLSNRVEQLEFKVNPVVANKQELTQ